MRAMLNLRHLKWFVARPALRRGNSFARHFTLALVRGPVHYQFGMFPPKRLGDVTGPADGPMRPQCVLQLFGGDLVPLNGLTLVIDQGRGMIVPMDFSERFVAVHA